MFSTCISKIWWRFLKNQFKNFVKPCHEELSSKAWSMWQHHIPQNHLNKIIYPQIYHRNPCLTVLISSNFLKRETLYLLWQPSVLVGNFTMKPPFLYPPKSSIHFDHEHNIPGHAAERRAYWFVLKTAWLFPVPSWILF